MAAEEAKVTAALADASERQRKAQADDAAGVFFVGLPVGSMTGGDAEGEISALKGQKEALAQARAAKGC